MTTTNKRIRLSSEQTKAELFAFSTPGKPTTEAQFEAFTTAWEGRLKAKISKYTSDPQRIEDIYQEIMILIVKKDLISQYDSSYGVPIHNWIYRFVEKFIKKFTHADYELDNRTTSLDKAINDESSAVNRIKYNQSFYEGDSPIPQAIEYLGKQTKTKVNKQDLKWLFQTLIEQLDTTGKISQREVAKKLGVSDKAVSYQMARLRERLLRSNLVTIDTRGSARWA